MHPSSPFKILTVLTFLALNAAWMVGCSKEESELAEEPNTDSQVERAATEDWPQFRGDPALTGIALGSLPENPALLWSFKTEGPEVGS